MTRSLFGALLALALLLAVASPAQAARAAAHQHGEGLFGLTIPLLDEPLDAKHAIGFAILAVLIPLLCYVSVRIDRRYQRRMQRLREQRARRQAPPPPPPPPAYTYGSGVDDWWDQSASRWSSDTPSWP
jgi:hypothetical protein